MDLEKSRLANSLVVTVINKYKRKKKTNGHCDCIFTSQLQIIFVFAVILSDWIVFTHVYHKFGPSDVSQKLYLSHITPNTA